MTRIGIETLSALLLVASALFLLSSAATGPVNSVHAETPSVGIESLSVTIGQSGSVTISADEVSVPPLGAWQLDILYDAQILTVVSCTPSSEMQACNIMGAPGVVRLAGAQATGFTGESVELAILTFSCDSLGESDLTVVVGNFADTNGFEMPHTVTNGQAACTLPSSVAVDGGLGTENLEESQLGDQDGSSGPSAFWYVVGGAVFTGLAILGLGSWLTVQRTRRTGDT